jgi:integrase
VRPIGRIRHVPIKGSRRGLRLATREIADEVLASIRDAIANGASEEVACAPYLTRQHTTVRKSYAAWLEHIRHLVTAGERSATYLRELERYGTEGGPLEAVFDYSRFELTYGVLEDLLKDLAERGIGQNTRPKIMGALSACLGWLETRGELDHTPRFPTTKKRKHLPRVISADGQEEVLALIPEKRRGAFYVAVEECVRPGEVRALNVSDYSWRSRELRIQFAMQGPCSSAERRGSKTDEPAVRVVSDRVADWLERHVGKTERLDGERPLFVNPTGRVDSGRWLGNALREEWNRAAARAGFHGIRMYEGTKHSTMTAMAKNGVDPRMRQAAARHRSPASTAIYEVLEQSAVTEAMRRRKPT